MGPKKGVQKVLLGRLTIFFYQKNSTFSTGEYLGKFRVKYSSPMIQRYVKYFFWYNIHP